MQQREQSLPHDIKISHIVKAISLSIKTSILLGIFFLSAVLADAQVCPPVGLDTTCGTIITITDTGATVTFTGQPPYDGIEDTLVGVVNNSSQPVRALGLRSVQSIFGFDGDGIVTFGIPGNGLDNTGYGGPNAYFTNINPSLTVGTVNFITQIAAHGGSSYFSLEESIGSAISCSTLVNNALSGPVLSGSGLIHGPTTISATFMPNLSFSLTSARDSCGFIDFNWVQTITTLPDPSPFSARNNGSPIHLTSASTPFNDPPAGGGYTYQGGPDNSYPFYYDRSSGELQGQQTINKLSFSDAPSDPCISGPLGLPSLAWLLSSSVRALCGNSTTPRGSFLGFTTHLAGVLPDGSAQDLGIGFAWTDNFNGTTGGIATTKNNLPVDIDSGEGGITVLSVQNTTNYDYNGVTVTTINGVPVSSLTAVIEINPPSLAPASVNPGKKGVIPVAIITTASFNAISVDVRSVRFGPNAASNTSPATLEDVNGDGALDLVLHFKSQEAGISCGDTTATLSGQTLTLQSFVGVENITTVGCR
jgi:hypothetical protein